MTEPLTNDKLQQIRERQHDALTGPLRYVHVRLVEEDIPALLGEVDRLRAELSRLKAINGHLEQEVRVMRARELA